jgi:signal transduction histidine kinase
MDLPGWVQERGKGVYYTGIGSFFQRVEGEAFWFVFPAYQPKRFEEPGTKLLLYHLAPSVMPNAENTFRKDGDVISILSTGGTGTVESAYSAELNQGADEKMLERVLVNLLTNSMNALIRADKKEISIETQYLNNRTVIRIQDSGEGINDKIQDKIFLPFFTTRQNGSGIGLTLAKSIMEAHNGYIVYRNVEGGSVFEAWFV